MAKQEYLEKSEKEICELVYVCVRTYFSPSASLLSPRL